MTEMIEGYVDEDGCLVKGSMVTRPLVHHMRCAYRCGSDRSVLHTHVHTWAFRLPDRRVFFGRNPGPQNPIVLRESRYGWLGGSEQRTATWKESRRGV